MGKLKLWTAEVYTFSLRKTTYLLLLAHPPTARSGKRRQKSSKGTAMKELTSNVARGPSS